MRSSKLVFWHWALLFPFVVGQSHSAINSTATLTAVGGSPAVSSVLTKTSGTHISTASGLSASSVSVLSTPTSSVTASSPSTFSSITSSQAVSTLTNTTASTSTVFSPFPVPSDVPQPPVYPAVNPSSPPAVSFMPMVFDSELTAIFGRTCVGWSSGGARLRPCVGSSPFQSEKQGEKL